MLMTLTFVYLTSCFAFAIVAETKNSFYCEKLSDEYTLMTLEMKLSNAAHGCDFFYSRRAFTSVSGPAERQI